MWIEQVVPGEEPAFLRRRLELRDGHLRVLRARDVLVGRVALLQAGNDLVGVEPLVEAGLVLVEVEVRLRAGRVDAGLLEQLREHHLFLGVAREEVAAPVHRARILAAEESAEALRGVRADRVGAVVRDGGLGELREVRHHVALVVRPGHPVRSDAVDADHQDVEVQGARFVCLRRGLGGLRRGAAARDDGRRRGSDARSGRGRRRLWPGAGRRAAAFFAAGAEDQERAARERGEHGDGRTRHGDGL